MKGWPGDDEGLAKRRQEHEDWADHHARALLLDNVISQGDGRHEPVGPQSNPFDCNGDNATCAAHPWVKRLPKPDPVVPFRQAHKKRDWRNVDNFIAILIVNAVAIYFIAHLIASNAICPGVTP